jgi:hypothetical protein
VVLSQFVADTRRQIFEGLEKGLAPTVGTYDEAHFKLAKDLGKPQLGPVVYGPDHVTFDFIYPGGLQGTHVLAVSVTTPDRIVYMAVPPWVVEQVWQGDVLGSYHFAEEAQKLISEFCASLEPKANAGAFGPAATYVRS